MFHRGFKHSKTIKARGRRPSAFISFLVFETPMKHSHSFLKYDVNVSNGKLFNYSCFYAVHLMTLDYRGSFLFLVAEFLRSEVMSCRREMCKLMYRVIQVKEKLIARADELTEVSLCKHSWYRATRKAVFMSVYNLYKAAVSHDVWIQVKVCPKSSNQSNWK